MKDMSKETIALYPKETQVKLNKIFDNPLCNSCWKQKRMEGYSLCIKCNDHHNAIENAIWFREQGREGDY